MRIADLNGLSSALKLVLGALIVAGVLDAPGALASGPPGRSPAAAAPLSSPSAPQAGVARAHWWIVTAKARRESLRVARRHHARPLRGFGGTQVYRVRGRYLRGMVRELRAKHLYVNHERDTSAGGTQAVPPDPLDPIAAWRPLVVDPNLAPPAVTPVSPVLAIVDEPIDLAHPEFAGGNTTTRRRIAPRGSHGTATAAIAGAPKNNAGIIGVWPGMRVLNVPLPNAGYACSDRVEAIAAALRAGASVISLEYAGRRPCFGERVMIQLAIGQGVVVVAGAGNTHERGNRRQFPASFPHVVTVAAVGTDQRRAPFSNANNAVDLSAPGVNLLTAVRPRDSGDPDGDGYAAVSGTSFAAAIVGAGAAWVQAARPSLGRSEVVIALLLSARDLQAPRWDAETGYGMLDIGAALQLDVPQNDPLEPNEDILWIDGSVFAEADESVGPGGRDETFVATVDRDEDPADVYRVVLPARGRARITVRPFFGDPDLAAYAPAARSIKSARHRIARSRRAGQHTERVVLTNRSRRTRTFFVAVRPRSLNSSYSMHLVRLPRAGA